MATAPNQTFVPVIIEGWNNNKSVRKPEFLDVSGMPTDPSEFDQAYVGRVTSMAQSFVRESGHEDIRNIRIMSQTTTASSVLLRHPFEHVWMECGLGNIVAKAIGAEIKIPEGRSRYRPRHIALVTPEQEFGCHVRGDLYVTNDGQAERVGTMASVDGSINIIGPVQPFRMPDTFAVYMTQNDMTGFNLNSSKSITLATVTGEPQPLHGEFIKLSVRNSSGLNLRTEEGTRIDGAILRNVRDSEISFDGAMIGHLHVQNTNLDDIRLETGRASLDIVTFESVTAGMEESAREQDAGLLTIHANQNARISSSKIDAILINSPNINLSECEIGRLEVGADARNLIIDGGRIDTISLHGSLEVIMSSGDIGKIVSVTEAPIPEIRPYESMQAVQMTMPQISIMEAIARQYRDQGR